MTALDIAIALIWASMIGILVGLFIYARRIGKRHVPDISEIDSDTKHVIAEKLGKIVEEELDRPEEAEEAEQARLEAEGIEAARAEHETREEELDELDRGPEG